MKVEVEVDLEFKEMCDECADKMKERLKEVAHFLGLTVEEVAERFVKLSIEEGDWATYLYSSVAFIDKIAKAQN